MKVRLAHFLEGDSHDEGSEVWRCRSWMQVEIKGDSEHDVLRKAAEHAKRAHHMDSIPPEVLSKVKGAIHDGGEARTQKAGSSD